MITKHWQDGLTIHIKAMWGMLEANTLPLPADPRSLEQFSQSFNTFKQVECVLEDAATANLVSEAEVKVLKQGHEGKTKLTPGMLFLDEVAIGMVTWHLAKLGIYIWGPDLTETADSLFNSACRLAALKSFCEVALLGPYVNVNKAYLNNFPLLTMAYNHFVHYLSAAHFKKELIKPGSHMLVTQRSVILR
ncbi:hypothetical protein CROQUDRAFT_52325 [Cronartium quercuum f. sp. fusiforme G11]|uniref:Uncharacterized protein n=1 Tax=Cronartium quercuum f. sp. fusiforme G11 TaxID=708437 RepID=A0A9P6NC67_9BASI|nr:hypothetical protein CROQUDRAFT_52325 [Cronartium quercuum f. sp. fusiforme G11]